MKFSVLLPTRNRIEYLKLAVDSVRSQSYDDWEIIISDNDSEENIKEFVDSLQDERILYVKTDSFVPVTENWNNALNHCSGDYIIMLGDDDALMDNYFHITKGLIEAYHQPDMLFCEALMFAYPGVFPDHPDGLLNHWVNAHFMLNKRAPYLLDKEQAIAYVKETLNFKVAYNFNMQFTLFKSDLINTLKKHGPFFQSPYPDYYATSALLLESERVLVVPTPLVIVGITKKSFGYYYFNELEEAGVEFLKNEPDGDMVDKLTPFVMPGTNMNTSWLFANETVYKNFGEKFDLSVNYQRYRFLQQLHIFKRYAMGTGSALKELSLLFKSLTLKERILYFPLMLIMATFYRLDPRPKQRFSRVYKKTIELSHPQYPMNKIDGSFENIMDVYQKVKIQENYSSLLPSQTALC